MYILTIIVIININFNLIFIANKYFIFYKI